MGVFGNLWDVDHASGSMVTGFLLSQLDFLPTFGTISIVQLSATVAFQMLVREPRKRGNE